MEVCSLTYVDSRGIFHFKKDLASLTTAQVREFSQIREIKAYKGQAHMPGFFYMTRTKRLVAYESRLEMLTLMQMDFNPSTVAVVSQPFILHVGEGKNSFEHIPDFLTISTAENITVVDVKPRAWVTRAENLRKFKGTQAACEVAGWNYSVQSEPDRLYIENLRWLAGYRRRPSTTDTYAEKLIEACARRPLPIQELVSNTGPAALVRPVLFHLLWHRLLEIDMNAHFNNQSLIDLPREAFRHGV